jgi:hypothetical protein
MQPKTPTAPPFPSLPQVDADPQAYKGKGKGRSFAADPALFPCTLSDDTAAKVGAGARGGGGRG